MVLLTIYYPFFPENNVSDASTQSNMTKLQIQNVAAKIYSEQKSSNFRLN
jgi:hypothetical protein